MKPETKFWHEIKTFATKNNCKLSFTRLENSAAWGTPDILGYNSFGQFFTIELKVTRGNSVRFSPHQFSKIYPVTDYRDQSGINVHNPYIDIF